MGTPGRAKALRAIGKAKRLNRQRIVRGERPVIGGQRVSAPTFQHVTGTSVKAIKAGGKPAKSQAKSKAAIKRKWGAEAL